MNRIIEKLGRKFPDSEIRIRENSKIFIYNPHTGIEEFYGKFSSNSGEILVNKNPLFHSRSWVNVSSFSTGTPGFSNFGKRGKKDGSKGLIFLSRMLGQKYKNRMKEISQEKQIQDEILPMKKRLQKNRELQEKLSYEQERKKKCLEILRRMRAMQGEIKPQEIPQIRSIRDLRKLK